MSTDIRNRTTDTPALGADFWYHEDGWIVLVGFAHLADIGQMRELTPGRRCDARVGADGIEIKPVASALAPVELLARCARAEGEPCYVQGSPAMLAHEANMVGLRVLSLASGVIVYP